MAWGVTRLTLQTQNTAVPSEKGLSTAVPPPWAGLTCLLSLRYWKAIGEAVKRPSDPF